MKSHLSILSAAVLFVLGSYNADAKPSAVLQSGNGHSSPGRPASQHRTAPASGSILYDQTSGMTGAVIPADNWTLFYASYSTQGADDFVVPTGQTWTIESFYIPYGQQASATWLPSSADVLLIADDGSGHPTGAVVCVGTATAETASGSNFTFTLATPCMLPQGTYWLELAFDGVVNFTMAAGWAVRSPVAGQPAQWQDPGHTYGTTCSTWGDFATCFPTVPSSRLGGDFAFQILGATDDIFFGGFEAP
ncbi:MAG: hypothetical protein U1F23_00925 [Lysobacterales bacterium]